MGVHEDSIIHMLESLFAVLHTTGNGENGLGMRLRNIPSLIMPSLCTPPSKKCESVAAVCIYDYTTI